MAGLRDPNNQRLEGAGDDQEATLGALFAGPEEPAPPSGVRPQIESALTAERIPTFEEAMAKIEAIEYGDHKALSTLVNNDIDGLCSKKVKYVKRVPNAPDGGAGWHVEGREDGPLDYKQSENLALAINKRVDLEKMHSDAEANRAKRGGQKGRKEEAETKPEGIDPETLKKLTEKLAEKEDMRTLTGFAEQCGRAGLLTFTEHPRKKGERHSKWDVEPIEGLEGSQELVQAINSKKKKLLKEIGKQKSQIEKLLQEIEYSPNRIELGKTAWSIHQAGLGVKKFTGQTEMDYILNPVPSRRGSKEVVEALIKREKELVAMEKREAKELVAMEKREALDRLLKD